MKPSKRMDALLIIIGLVVAAASVSHCVQGCPTGQTLVRGAVWYKCVKG